MNVEKFPLIPPSLEELAQVLAESLAANYEDFSIQVAPCPDLRQAPFLLANEGLCGDEKISDVGGQPNLFPRPRLDQRWSMPEIAKAMEMSPEKGSLLGAGAGPFPAVGQNCELCPNISWQTNLDEPHNKSYIAEIDRQTGEPGVRPSPNHDCGLMINLFGSAGSPGPVLKIRARTRIGDEGSFTECIRKGLRSAYGESRTVSLGGVFLMKSGRASFHIMPDFPPESELPFESQEQKAQWLRFFEFDAPMLCFSVLHSADPDGKMGLRIEHTHGYSPTGQSAGGHYHHDIDGNGDVEYEAYFNTAKCIYRIDRPVART